MQTFNEEKKKYLENIAPGAISTAGTVAQGLAQKANPTLTESSVSGAVPAVGSQVNKSGKVYNPNENYMQRSMNAAANGNLAGAMYNERMHNIKDGDMGLGWGASGIWNYQDMQGLGGQREGKYNEIENYFSDGFQYDYRDDEQYKAIKSLKEKEAQKAYNDGYAQLSTQFEGDIPVNMINKLLTTKSEIADQADSYIPQLRQLAYDMYMDKGNQLYNQYSMLDSQEQNQYGRFLNDRDFMAQGVNDARSRNYQLGRDAVYDARYADETAYNRGRDAINDSRYDSEWAYQLGRDAVYDGRYNSQWEYQMQRDAKSDEQWEDELAFRKWAAMP